MNRSSEQSGDGSLVAAAGVVVLQNLSQSSPLQQQQQQHQQHHDHNYDAVAAPTSSIIAPPPTTLPPRRVDHTYRDFSNFPIDELPAARGKRTPTNFPSKLHQILSNPEYAHVSWNDARCILNLVVHAALNLVHFMMYYDSTIYH